LAACAGVNIKSIIPGGPSDERAMILIINASSSHDGINSILLYAELATAAATRPAMPQSDQVVRTSGNKFSLEKYYADLVTAEGEYFIGYSALLSWATIKINYRATLHHPSLSGVSAGPSLSAGNSPVADDHSVTWRSPKLGFDGQWQQLASSERQVLHETEEGAVQWECLQPSARVQLTTASGATYRGLGYVELLTMTIPPWRLGLQTLLWGRFVSENHSVVWVEWQGKYNLILLICDGRKAMNPQISDFIVRCDEFELSLEHVETIRDDSIEKTLVSKIPSILRVAPFEFLGGKEQKIVSRGRLTFPDGSEHSGWVIHERVTWGQNRI
jgi:hypothetical protein